MLGDIDVRTILAAADRAADIAEKGWSDYTGPGPGRYAGLTTAIVAGRRIPHLLRTLKNTAPGWDDWWEAMGPLHDTTDAAYIAQLRTIMDHPGVEPGPREDHLDATFSRELMRRAPRGTVSWFLNDDLGRSGWKVKLPDGSLEDVFFTIPMPIARAYASYAVAPDGRPLEMVFPGYLWAMRSLIATAHERFAM